MAKQASSKSGKKGAAEGKFFEIVNWKKAQPRMKGGGQEWMKLYTSLMDHEGFAGLSEVGQITLIALWLYAARTGHHILPADPKWLYRRIPMLKKEPDLGPLAEAVDAFDTPNPFIKFCDAPKARKSRSKKTQQEKTRVEKKRVEERETNPTGSKEKNRLEKDEIQQHSQQQTDPAESEELENPKKSEVGSAKVYHLPKPTRPATRGPQQIGDIIDSRYPEHWRDPDAQEFGWAIVEALGYSTDKENEHSRSEWGSFASFWCNVKKYAPLAVLDDLRCIAIEKAEFVNSPKGKSAKNKSAVWFEIMYGELNHHGVKMPRKRAGP